MKIKKIALLAAAIFQMLTVSAMAPEPSEPDQNSRELIQRVLRADDDTRDPVVKYTTEAWRLFGISRVFGMSKESFRFVCENFSRSETLSGFITIVCSMDEFILILEDVPIRFQQLHRPMLMIGTYEQVGEMFDQFHEFLRKALLSIQSTFV
jgi:hypothetical protein